MHPHIPECFFCDSVEFCTDVIGISPKQLLDEIQVFKYLRNDCNPGVPKLIQLNSA